MEIFLLLLDEIDDAVGVLRSYSHYFFGFIAALVLFCATGWLLLRSPLVAVAVVASTSLLVIAAQARARMNPLALDIEG